MAAAIALRSDFTGPDLRHLARRTEDARQARRLLALAEIYDGGSRSDAARIGDVGISTTSLTKPPQHVGQERSHLAPEFGVCSCSSKSIHSQRATWWSDRFLLLAPVTATLPLNLSRFSASVRPRV